MATKAQVDATVGVAREAVRARMRKVQVELDRINYQLMLLLDLQNRAHMVTDEQALETMLVQIEKIRGNEMP